MIQRYSFLCIFVNFFSFLKDVVYNILLIVVSLYDSNIQYLKVFIQEGINTKIQRDYTCAIKYTIVLGWFPKMAIDLSLFLNFSIYFQKDCCTYILRRAILVCKLQHADILHDVITVRKIFLLINILCINVISVKSFISVRFAIQFSI